LPAGRIRHDEQVQANEFAQEIENDRGGKVVLVPAPAQFDGVVSQLRNAPRLGANTDDVLRELGRSDEQIAQLRADGIVA
jgi:formyl-CoA transferase